MRRFLAVLLTIVAILGVGWLSLRRADIPFNTLESAYASPESTYVAGDGGERVHMRDQGVRDGPVLVLVHGFSASLHTWEPWVRELEDSYRIISLDLPGHGLTRGFSIDEVDMEGFGAVITKVTEAAGVERFTLVGSSMGGHAAWTYALDNPEKLDALVLVGAAGWPYEAGADEETPLVFRLLENPVARTLIRDLDNSAMIRSGLEDSFVDETMVTDEMVQRYAALNRGPGHRDAILHIITSSDERTLATVEKLQSLDVPTLVMHGRQDNLVPFSGGEKFSNAIPGAQLRAYDEVGHLPHEEIARQSAADLHQFLQGLDSVDGTVVEEPDLELTE